MSRTQEQHSSGEQPLSIAAIAERARNGPLEASLPLQVVSVEQRLTRDGKPFLLLATADATGQLSLKIWSDHPQRSVAERLAAGQLLSISGEFAIHPQFGLEARRWSFRPLSDEERAAFLSGPPALRAKQEADFAEIERLLDSIADPRLRGVCRLFLDEHGSRFRRAAAARFYHHGRRGGLVEHVAQMMRAGDALATAYGQLNRDLLLAGALLHDCGKLWETCPPEVGFAIQYDPRGELLGHIVIGIEIVNSLWKKLLADPLAGAWETLRPRSEEVRLHLLHLIASHHGDYEFGSPVVPKTPEAFALHTIDELDAKLESVREALATGARLSEGIIERLRPLPGNLVEPLANLGPTAKP